LHLVTSLLYYVTASISIVSMICFMVVLDAQGRNADALALYFNEDPAKCPFEQGRIVQNISSPHWPSVNKIELMKVVP